MEEYLTVHYKGNIPKGALGAIQSPRRRRNNIERNDSDASDYDDELLNERSIRNKSSKTVDRGGTIRRDKESSYDHEIAVVSASMRQNKLADRFHDQKGSQSRRFEVNNEDNLVYSDSRGRNDKKATNFQRVPYRRYSEGVDSQEDFSDDNYSEDDGLRNRRNREKDKKTNKGLKQDSKSEWVTKTEYDALSNLCETLLRQQTELQQEVKQQARIIEVVKFKLPFIDIKLTYAAFY